MFITISPYNRRVNTLAAAPAKIDTYRAINITKNPLYSNKKDVFVKSKKISFGSAEYNRQAAEELINDIANKKVTTNKRGFQAEFFALGERFGIKSINPLDKTAQSQDLHGINNLREHYILNVIKNINPEIATEPVDLIQKDNKYFLVTELVKGTHPFDTGINSNQIKNILKNAFILDINGIVHSDLQSGNIFLLDNDKVKFIDFGAYQLLSNKGSYVSSDSIGEYDIKNSTVKNLHNSSLEGKFLATFYNHEPVTHIISYCDNPYLKIKSNAANFEYRMIYDFLSHNKAENPKEFLTGYLKNKAQYYHKPLAGFLEKLEISLHDTEQIAQRDSAKQTEKLFAGIFSNPSENVLKSELEKIQLKWLMNDYQGGKTKAFDCYEKYIANLEKYSAQATESEKQYFDIMKKVLEKYKSFLNVPEYKGDTLDDSQNPVKRIFEESKTNLIKQKDKIIKTTKSNNKIALLITGLTAAASVFGLWHYNNHKKAG